LIDTFACISFAQPLTLEILCNIVSKKTKKNEEEKENRSS